MSIVNVLLVTMSASTPGGKSEFAIPDNPPMRKQLVTATTTAVPADSAVAPAGTRNDSIVWFLQGISGNSWIKIGTAPVAAAGDEWYLPEGGLLVISAVAGEKVSVIAAT